jgi:glucose-1-phosphate cytidylyltransferase
MMNPTVLILCGGEGQRMRPLTERVPKSLQMIDGVPLLRHLLDSFIVQGFRDFVLAAGYHADQITAFSKTFPPDVRVNVVDSGCDALPGERILACSHLLSEPSIIAYGDGLAQLDYHRLLKFHHSHGQLATITVARMTSPYGIATVTENDYVSEFRQKPLLDDVWVNIGFMVFSATALKECSSELESHVLAQLARSHELVAFRHTGYWRAIDTIADLWAANNDALNGARPWLISSVH